MQPFQSLSDADIRQILEARAAALAAVPAIEVAGEQRSVVCFQLGASRYATDSIHVLEVSVLNDCVPIPCTPPHVAGLVNQRGRLLTVIDLRPILGLP